MQIPDRLNPGGSLPIAGPTPTPRPPIKLRELTFPDLDTPTSPQPTPDYSDLIQELLESIPVPPTPGPSQAMPPPTMPTPTAPPSPLPGMPPLPIGEQGFLPIPGLEQLPGAELPHAGFYGNIPAEVGAAVPPGFFGAITSPVLGGLGKAVGVLGDVERTTGIEAPAQQAWTSPMAVAAAGLTPGGAERQEMRREATVDGTALGRWLDGQYGNVTSMDALRKMHTDLRTAQREGGIALEIASGFASPTAMIPMPLIDPLFGVLLKGVWKGIKIPFKARGFIADLLSSEKPAKTLTSEQVAQHQRAKETITQSHPRAREGIEIPKNPIQEVVDETTSGNYAFVRYTTDIINGEEAEVIRVYKEVDPLSTEYQMYRDMEAQGLGVLVRPGETVNPQVLDNYRARNEARQAAEEADVDTVPDAPVEPEVEVAPTEPRITNEVIEAQNNLDMAREELKATREAPGQGRAPKFETRERAEWNAERMQRAAAGTPIKTKKQLIAEARDNVARMERRLDQAQRDAAAGIGDVVDPDAPIAEPAAPTEAVPIVRTELAMSVDEMKAALESGEGRTIIQAFRNSLARYPQTEPINNLPDNILDEWDANADNLSKAMAEWGVGSTLSNDIYANIYDPVDTLLRQRGTTLSDALIEFDNLSAANGYTGIVGETPGALVPSGTRERVIRISDVDQRIENGYTDDRMGQIAIQQDLRFLSGIVDNNLRMLSEAGQDGLDDAIEVVRFNIVRLRSMREGVPASQPYDVLRNQIDAKINEAEDAIKAVSPETVTEDVPTPTVEQILARGGYSPKTPDLLGRYPVANDPAALYQQRVANRYGHTDIDFGNGLHRFAGSIELPDSEMGLQLRKGRSPEDAFNSYNIEDSLVLKPGVQERIEQAGRGPDVFFDDPRYQNPTWDDVDIPATVRNVREEAEKNISIGKRKLQTMDEENFDAKIAAMELGQRLFNEDKTRYDPFAVTQATDHSRSFSFIEGERSKAGAATVPVPNEHYLPTPVIKNLYDTRNVANSGAKKISQIEQAQPGITDSLTDAVRRGRAALTDVGVETENITRAYHKSGLEGLRVLVSEHHERFIRNLPEGNTRNFAENIDRSINHAEAMYGRYLEQNFAFVNKYQKAVSQERITVFKQEALDAIEMLDSLIRLGPDNEVAGAARAVPLPGALPNMHERSLARLRSQPGVEAVPEGVPLDPNSRTYDEWQKAIDDMEDQLEAQGVDVSKMSFPEDVSMWDQFRGEREIGLMPGWHIMPDELVQLYRARDAAPQLGHIFRPKAREIPGATWEEKWGNLPLVVRKIAEGSGRFKLTVAEQEQLRDFIVEFGQTDQFNGTIVEGYGGQTLEFHLGYFDIGSPGGMRDGYIIWNPSTNTSREGNVFGVHRTRPDERSVRNTRNKVQRGAYGKPDDEARETLGIFSLEDTLPDPALPDVPSTVAGIQPDMFGRANKAVYISDADMTNASFNLTPDEQASGLEQVRGQVDNGEKDIFDGLTDASNIIEGRTPGTSRPQYFLSTKTSREATSITVEGTNPKGLPYSYQKQVTRYRVTLDWQKSRSAGTFAGADPDELRQLQTPDTMGWIVAHTDHADGTGPVVRYSLNAVGEDGLPAAEIASFKTLREAQNNLRWDTANDSLGVVDDHGNFQIYGGGGGTAFPGAPGDYSGPTGQIRLNNAINVDLMQLKTLKRLIANLTEKGITRGATRLRISAGEIADRLDTLVGRIEDQDFPGGNAMGLRRAVYQETSTIRAVSPDERSVFIARRDEPERMGMGLGVQEKVEFINSRLTDHRFTRQILDQTIAEKGEDWEDLVQLIYGDIYDEAEELRVLADNLPVEGTEASQALAAGLRDEVYDEIGEVDPRWRIWDVAEGGGGPSGATDPELARELERAAEAGERVSYIPDRPHNMADKDFGAPDPPNMNKRSEGDDWGFISLRNIRSLDAFYDEDVIVHDSAAVRHIYTWTPMRFVDDTVRKNTPAGRLMTSWMMAQVADDQWIDVTLQATFDAYAKKGRFGFGKATMNLPINRETGFWGDSGLHWADVWSFWNGKHKGHIDKYADRLDGKLRHLIAEFSNVVNEEVEQIREINGLPRRKKKRGPGEVYIPRKVEGIRDKETGKLIPFEKPTNPNHERLWEMATEAYQRHGVDYTTDPRAVLELHLRSALKEIRHHQMEEMMERLDLAVTIMRKVTDPETGRVTTVPGPLVNPAIWAKKVETQQAYIEATQRLKEVSKAIFGEEIWSRMGQGISNIHVDLDLAADISRAQEAMRSAPEFAENLKRLNDEYDELAGKMVEVTSADGTKRMERRGGSVTRLKRESTTARKAYHKHIKRLKNSAYVEITGGKSGLFGGAVADGLYPITANRFKTKFFLTEDYNEIKDFIRGIDPEQREGFGPAFIQGFQTVVNVQRFLASVGDFAMPFINLFPVLGENPKAWSTAVLNHYKAWADPTVQSRLIRDNIQEYYDLAINGVPVGDPEFFAALAPGQGINLENVMRKWEQKRPPANKAEKAIFKSLKEAQHGGKLLGRQTFGRFQTSYQTGLGHARMMLLKSLRSSWKGTDNELYSYIRNMTGGMDSRRSGIMPGQRAFEGMFLAFSPRLFRSTVALATDAMQALPRMGAKRLGRGTGSTAQQRRALKSISQLIAGVYGIYYVTARYGFGMEDDEIMDGMNPASGRRFLSVPIHGDWVGVGGQIRALMQFSWAMMGLMSEGNIPGTQEDRKWSDLWSTNSMKNPFVYLYMSRGAPGTRAISSIGEAYTDIEMLPFDNPDGTVDLLTHYGEDSLPFALQHLLESKTWETSAMEFFGARASFNPRDRATQYITSGEENVYTDQPKMVKWLVNELIETEQSEFDSIEMKRRKELLALHGTDFNYLTWLGIEKYYSGARGWASEEVDFGPPDDLDDPDPNKRALAEYYSLFRDKRVRDAEGISMPDGSEMFSRLLDFKANNPVSQGGFGWTQEQKQYVVANTNTRPVPWFVLQKVGGTRADSIKRSQKLREQIFIDMGRRDLAMISHRLFYMLPPGQGAYSDVIDQMVEGSPPDFGPSNVEDLWEWQRERLVGAGAP